MKPPRLAPLTLGTAITPGAAAQQAANANTAKVPYRIVLGKPELRILLIVFEFNLRVISLLQMQVAPARASARPGRAGRSRSITRPSAEPIPRSRTACPPSGAPEVF